MNLDAFRMQYPAQPPKFAPKYTDEWSQMTAQDGLCSLLSVLGDVVRVSTPPLSTHAASTGRHLWVIGPADVPYANEHCAYGASLTIKIIKHTNLTAGSAAHCGGELWFLTDGRVLINGNSGRYGPSSADQLRNAALSLQSLGYQVGFVGFDESNLPAAVAISEDDVEWL